MGFFFGTLSLLLLDISKLHSKMGPRFVPQNSPIVQFETISTQSRTRILKMAKKVSKRFGNFPASSELRLTDISQRGSVLVIFVNIVFCKDKSDRSLAGSQCFSLLVYCRCWLQVGSFS